MQRLCKSNAIKLALITEMPPILCKDTVFLSHRQTSWIILTQRLRVSVQKCHNAPICGLFAKPANFIFKFLSLKISLIQADCHWKQVLVVRSTRFHSLEQSLEILPERDSDLLASLDKGIEHCRFQCTLNTTEEQRALALYGLGTYRSFCCQVIYGIFTIVSIDKDLLFTYHFLQ